MSLIEVLCAVTLLSFLLLPIFQFVLRAGTDARRSSIHMRALFLAQKRLEEAVLLGPTAAGALPDAEVDRFHIQVVVSPFKGSPDLHDFAVKVSWPNDRGPGTKEVQLRSLLCELSL